MILESDFWHDLAAEFRALKQRDPDGLWRADWRFVLKVEEQSAPIPQWRLVGSGSSAHPIQYEFEALARRGGPKIYPNMDSLVGWFEAIRTSPLNTGGAQCLTETGTDGSVVARHYSGSIKDVFQASMDVCKYYECL